MPLLSVEMKQMPYKYVLLLLSDEQHQPVQCPDSENHSNSR